MGRKKKTTTGEGETSAPGSAGTALGGPPQANPPPANTQAKKSPAKPAEAQKKEAPAQPEQFKFDFTGKPAESKDANKEPFKFDFSAPYKPAEDANKGKKKGAKFDSGNPFGGKKPQEEEEEEEDAEEAKPIFDFTSGNDAQLLNAFKKKLGNLVGQSSGYFEELSKPVQRRIQALKKLQEEKDDIEKEFKKELEALEKKYQAKYEPLYKQRADIVNGAVEPSHEESGERVYEITDEEEAEILAGKSGSNKNAKEKKSKDAKKEKEAAKKEEEGEKGIPSFWLEALRHHDDFGEMITEGDEAALKYLKDIRTKPLDEAPHGFVLEFEFGENPFFDEKVISKSYFLTETEMGEILYDHVEASEIHWKPGKNLTVRTVKKKAKAPSGRKKGGKGGKAVVAKEVTVEEPCPSFFNFFNPDAALDMIPEDDDEEGEFDRDEEMQGILEADYEMGLDIKDKIIPNAVLWFTGEAVPDDFGGMFGGEDDEEGEFDEDDDEEDDDDDDGHGHSHSHGHGGHGHSHSHGRKAKISNFNEEEYNSEEDEDYKPGQQEKPECKQS